MTDIKELALRVVQDGDDDEGTDEWIIDFAQRFLAAYLAEQVSPAKEQALDALDCMDDFARMADIDPIGPRKVLEDYINGAAPSSEEGCSECGKKASDGWALYCVTCFEPLLCAAPSSEEVREMVERLRSYTICTVSNNEAANLIERLAARVPDGCVVVPREPTDEMCQAASARCHHPQALYKTAYKAMIAAGEVKP